MALNNRERVDRAFGTLAKGLRPFVDSRLTPKQTGGKRWPDALSARDGKPHSPDDPAALLKSLNQYWPAFKDVLGRSARGWANELLELRNNWAHWHALEHDDTYRVLDTVERLLNAVSAGDRAAEVRTSKEELVRLRYEELARRAARTATAPAEGTVGGLVAWRDLALPHKDVREGTFSQAEFAADLAQVHRGDTSAAPEYADPVEFFRRTFLTTGLEGLLRQGVQRVVGAEGGIPVIDLQTNFGGGKTHALLALYHLFSGTSMAGLPQEVQEAVHGAGVEGDLPPVGRVVLVGTMLKPGQPVVKHDGTQVNTLWGEFAWQLGGREAFDRLAASDAARTNPGDVLVELLRAHAPCVILIDEWVAYARQLIGRDDLPAGTFETQFSFAQALTEAARAVPGVLLVVSLPGSTHEGGSVAEIEVGGPAGEEALRRLRNVVHRVDSSWRPASVEESFEIVRRRLFEPIPHERMPERDAVARRFVTFYGRHTGEFPKACGTAEYERRIIRAYPIHPELFDRLYEDWSTLERFQRTRGVLRLMAKVIHALWHAGDQSPMILPASVPLDDPQVATELARYLEENWKPILDADVDGLNSVAVKIDTERPVLGQGRATRRVARAIFVGSAPTNGAHNRGIEEVRVRLGVVLPGENPALFGDALRMLAEQSAYLYAEGSRYWFSTRPTVSKKARDLADRNLWDVDRLHGEITSRLRKLERKAGFRAIHACPPDSADVPDTPECRLVVVPPAFPHQPRATDTPGLRYVRDMLDQRGTAKRHYRNALVFLAADNRRVRELERGVAEYLAWKEISDRKVELNLDPQQQGQAAHRLGESEEAVRGRLAETYQVLLVPAQADPTAPTTWEELRCDGPEGLASRAAERLITHDLLRIKTNPASIRADLDGVLAYSWEGGHISVADLWDLYGRYCYLSRLRDESILREAVTHGPQSLQWEVDGFAIADTYDPEAQRYRGLVGGAVPTGVISASLVVRPDVAQRQLAAEEAERGERQAGSPGDRPGDATGGRSEAAGGRDGEPEPPPPPPKPRRFHGSVSLDPEQLAKQFGKVNEEILSHLRAYPDGRLTVSIDIAASAASDGFSETLIRTVSENARALGFDHAAFEEE